MDNPFSRFAGLLRTFAARTAPSEVRLLPWIPAAMVEDDDAPYPEEARLTPARLALLASNLDHRLYRPPVITGADPEQRTAGPSHWVGEYLDPLGWIEEAVFDGVTLWLRLSELVVDGVGRITDAISRGRLKRSIGFFFPYEGGPVPPVTGGWMLRHLALTGGEVEGQWGLPPLTQSVPGAIVAPVDLEDDAARFASALPQLGTSVRLAGVRYAVRHLELPAGSGQPQEEDPAMPMTPEEMAALTAQIGELVTATMAAQVAPITEQITTLAAGQEELRTQLTAHQTAATAEVRTAQYRAALDALQASGRIAPGEYQEELQTLLDLTPERATSRLAVLEARSPMLPVALDQRTFTLQIGEGEESLEEIVPVSVLRSATRESLEELQETVRAAGGVAKCRTDPRAFAAAAQRVRDRRQQQARLRAH